MKTSSLRRLKSGYFVGRQSWGALAWPQWFHSLPWGRSWAPCGAWVGILISNMRNHGVAALPNPRFPGIGTTPQGRTPLPLKETGRTWDTSPQQRMNLLVREEGMYAPVTRQLQSREWILQWKLGFLPNQNMRSGCILYPPHRNTCISVDFSFTLANVQVFSSYCVFFGNLFVLFVFQSLICS